MGHPRHPVSPHDGSLSLKPKCFETQPTVIMVAQIKYTMSSGVAFHGLKPAIISRFYSRGKHSRAPGGALPEGWEFFCETQKPIWFGFRGIDDNGRPGYHVMAVLPMKCPLDDVFQTALAAKMVQNILLAEDRDDEPELSRRERMAREKERTSVPRYVQFIPARQLHQFVQSLNAAYDLRAVINLCATERYYDASQGFGAPDVQYRWFKINGGGQMMDEQQAIHLRNLFMDTVLRYGSFVPGHSPPTAQSLRKMTTMPVTVLHCTHGVNRTGYVLLTLMCLFGLDADLTKGVNAFFKARGHDINKEEFVAHVDQMFLDPRGASDFAELRARVVRSAFFTL